MNIDPQTFDYLESLGYNGDNPEIFIIALGSIASAMREYGYDSDGIMETMTMVVSNQDRADQGSH